MQLYVCTHFFFFLFEGSITNLAKAAAPDLNFVLGEGGEEAARTDGSRAPCDCGGGTSR